MSTLPSGSTPRAAHLWRDPPRRTGLARRAAIARRLLILARDLALTRFIDLLGAFSTPGVPSVGRLQAWALRRMGVDLVSDQVWLAPDVRIEWPTHLVLGARVTLNRGTHIVCHDQVRIGDDFLAAPGLMINSGTHDLATLRPASAPVEIGPGVWCGARVTICAGVSIGRDSVLGAGSVVVRDLPAYQICLGVPARPVRDLRELRESRSESWSNFAEA
jgi:acetyltransferase-like isoleucine patch superfamily enzyme